MSNPTPDATKTFGSAKPVQIYTGEELQKRISEIAASPDAILALIADLENERRKVTELVDGYEKDQAELKRLRTTIITDNTQTVVNAEKYAQACQDEADELRAEVERLTALEEATRKANLDCMDHYNEVLADWKEATAKNREMLAEVEQERTDYKSKCAELVIVWAERDLLKMREVSWESSLMAASAQNEQLRSLLNTYNLGGWTDSLALMKERDEWRTIATTAHRYIEENKALQAMKGQTHD